MSGWTVADSDACTTDVLSPTNDDVAPNHSNSRVHNPASQPGQNVSLSTDSLNLVSSPDGEIGVHGNTTEFNNRQMSKNKNTTRVGYCRIVLGKREHCVEGETNGVAYHKNKKYKKGYFTKEIDGMISSDGGTGDHNIIEYLYNGENELKTLTTHHVNQEMGQINLQEHNKEFSFECDPNDNSIIELSSNDNGERETLISHYVPQDTSDSRLYLISRLEPNKCLTLKQKKLDCGEVVKLENQVKDPIFRNKNEKYHQEVPGNTTIKTTDPCFHKRDNSTLRMGGPGSAFKPIVTMDKPSSQDAEIKQPISLRYVNPISLDKNQDFLAENESGTKEGKGALPNTTDTRKLPYFEGPLGTKQKGNKRSHVHCRKICIKPPNIDFNYHFQNSKKSEEKQNSAHLEVEDSVNKEKRTFNEQRNECESQIRQTNAPQIKQKTDVYALKNICASDLESNSFNVNMKINETHLCRSRDSDLIDSNDALEEKDMPANVNIFENKERYFTVKHSPSKYSGRANHTSTEKIEAVKPSKSKKSLTINCMTSPNKNMMLQNLSTSIVNEDIESFYTPPDKMPTEVDDILCQNSNNGSPPQCCETKCSTNSKSPICFPAPLTRDDTLQKERRTSLMRKNLNLREAACSCSNWQSGNRAIKDKFADIGKDISNCHSCHCTQLTKDIRSIKSSKGAYLKNVRFHQKGEVTGRLTYDLPNSREATFATTTSQIDRATSVSPRSVRFLYQNDHRNLNKHQTCSARSGKNCDCCSDENCCDSIDSCNDAGRCVTCSLSNLSLESDHSSVRNRSPTCDNENPCDNISDRIKDYVSCRRRDTIENCISKTLCAQEPHCVACRAQKQCSGSCTCTRRTRGSMCADYGFSIIIFLLGMVFALLFPYL